MNNDKSKFSVKLVPNDNIYVNDFVLNHHYMKRLPTYRYCFLLYKEDEPVGTITYGNPSVNMDQRLNCKTLELTRLFILDKSMNTI